MTEEKLKNESLFKYNMSFYYQSTIIYFVAFTIYLIIRGEFVDNSYLLVTKDPIIFFFALIVLISILSLLFNLIKNRHLEVTNEGIAFIDRFRRKAYRKEDIIRIKITKSRTPVSRKALRLIVLTVKNRRRRIIIRPSDYENDSELLKRFVEFKSELNN